MITKVKKAADHSKLRLTRDRIIEVHTLKDSFIVCLSCVLLSACGGSSTQPENVSSEHSLSSVGTGPLPRTATRGVLVVGWREEKHSPWSLKRLIVDGKVKGLWARDGQIPGAIDITAGTHQVVVEANHQRGGAKSAPRTISIAAGEIIVCAVDVTKRDVAPDLSCGRKSGEPVITASTPEPSSTMVTQQEPESEPRKTTTSRSRRGSDDTKANISHVRAPVDPSPPSRQQVSEPTPEPSLQPQRGRSKLGKIKAIGGKGEMSPDSIRERFSESKSIIMDCYDKQIRAKNFTKGIVLIDFMVWTDGCSAEVTARIRNKGLTSTAQCIESVLKGFCFDAPRGGPVKFRVPLLFEPEPPEQKGRRR